MIINFKEIRLCYFIIYFYYLLKEKTVAKFVPYFDGKYLSETAALNGGNSISLFVSNLYESLQLFGCSITYGNTFSKIHYLYLYLPIDKVSFICSENF